MPERERTGELIELAAERRQKVIDACWACTQELEALQQSITRLAIGADAATPDRLNSLTHEVARLRQRWPFDMLHAAGVSDREWDAATAARRDQE